VVLLVNRRKSKTRSLIYANNTYSLQIAFEETK
jgi:hypothetical protein